MDILITPGTFNPPGTLAVVHGFLDFPKTPFQQVKRPALQYNSRWVEEEETPPPPLVTLPVIYSYCDFITGDITVGVELDGDPFDAGITNFTTAGARYIPDNTYAKTAHDGVGETYSAVGTPQFTITGGTQIDIGTVEAEYGGDFAMPSNGIRVLLGFVLTVTGTGDAATYTLTNLDESAPGAAVGTIVLPIAYPVTPSSNGFISQTLDAQPVVTVTLLRNGQPFEKIYLAVRITGEVNFTLVPLSPGASLDIPEVDTGSTWVDTLHGPTVTAPTVSGPGITFAGYVRESWASQGELSYTP